MVSQLRQFHPRIEASIRLTPDRDTPTLALAVTKANPSKDGDAKPPVYGRKPTTAGLPHTRSHACMRFPSSCAPPGPITALFPGSVMTHSSLQYMLTLCE